MMWYHFIFLCVYLFLVIILKWSIDTKMDRHWKLSWWAPLTDASFLWSLSSFHQNSQQKGEWSGHEAPVMFRHSILGTSVSPGHLEVVGKFNFLSWNSVLRSEIHILFIMFSVIFLKDNSLIGLIISWLVTKSENMCMNACGSTSSVHTWIFSLFSLHMLAVNFSLALCPKAKSRWDT